MEKIPLDEYVLIDGMPKQLYAGRYGSMWYRREDELYVYYDDIRDGKIYSRDELVKTIPEYMI